MGDKRQKNQLQMVLAFAVEGRSEAPKARREGTESLTAKRTCESPVIPEQVMEEVCARENLKQALRRVRSNKGSPGIEGRTVDELPGDLKQQWPAIREQLLNGTYQPQAVRRGDRQARRRGAQARHSNGAGSVYPAGGAAGSASKMGPDVFRTQSRVSSATLGASGGGQGAAVYRRRQPLGGGPRSGKVFRSSQSRPTDGGDCAAGERQENAQADPSFLGVGRDGEWTGECGGGGNSARRAFVSAAVEPGARRTRPGVGATPAPFRALRG